MRTLLIVFVLLIASVAQAQERKLFYTSQECGPAEQMVQNMAGKYGEKPLFTGENTTIDPQGIAFKGAAMFFVNQDSGTWSLLTLYNDGTVCVSAAGTKFEPHVD